ncbi:hypothetical protein [Robiginitalea sediminis]|uniref:hypothetical protein n=1 Tax=Robiginitalea sediminis TaxID=1982593 RepID=UPI00130398A5|nr:hypothetical protein [Robiginitalea sediminis]
MDVIHEIIAQSPIGAAASWFRALILSLFIAIVTLLGGMLGVLLLYGNQFQFSFGY